MAKSKKMTSESWHDKQFAKAEKVLEKNYKKILRRKGVTGVEVNYRKQDGKLTDEIVICVHVKEKLPLEELHPNQIIEKIEGIPVDIVETMNEFEALSSNIRAGTGIAPVIKGRVRGEGTFGVTVFDQNSGQPFMLTNAHVVRGGSPKSKLPSKVPMVTGKNKTNVVGNAIIARSFLTSKADCALVAPAPGVNLVEGIKNVSKTLFRPGGDFAELQRRHLRARVKIVKFGQKTRETTGQLVAIRHTFSVPGHTFLFQIVVRRMGNKPFSTAGDSGSVIIHDGRIVGLLHGLSSDKKFAVACPIKEVRRLLNI